METGLGPTYNYVKFIKNPNEMGMSDSGKMKVLTQNIKGLKAYVDMMVTGKSEANKKGRKEILGSKFFIETGAKCVDYENKDELDRHLYISNTASGVIPGISDITGFKATSFRGLVPGMVQNMNALNPVKLFRAFKMGSNPLCASVSLPVIDENHSKSTKTGNIPLMELDDLMNSDERYKKIIPKKIKEAIDKMKIEEEQKAIKDSDKNDEKNETEKNEKKESMRSYQNATTELGYLMYLRQRLSSNDIQEQQRVLKEHSDILSMLQENTLSSITPQALRNMDYYDWMNYLMTTIFTLISVYIVIRLLQKGH
jgi:hypothetical protein